MLGLFESKDLCKDCKHALKWHFPYHHGCSICKCSMQSEGMDNLTYVEYVASQTFWKRILTDIIHWPLTFYAWYRGSDDLTEFITMKCVLIPLLGTAVVGLVLVCTLAVKGCNASAVHDDYMLKHATVRCYAGDHLLYTGLVKSYEEREGSIKIELDNGNTYVCSSASREIAK